MEIMAFNINRFKTYNNDGRLCRKVIIDYIKNFLEKGEENIAIIQEMAYPPGKNNIYTEVINLLGEKYEVMLPDIMVSNVRSITCAIKKSSNLNWVKDKNSIIKNEFSHYFIDLKYKNNKIRLLGAHMPMPKKGENIKEYNNLWRLIEQRADSIDEPYIIIGDLNAHRHLYRESTYKSHLNNFKKYKDCVTDDIVTYFGPQTTVDHAFYKGIKAKLISSEVKNFSDHLPIVINVDAIDNDFI